MKEERHSVKLLIPKGRKNDAAVFAFLELSATNQCVLTTLVSEHTNVLPGLMLYMRSGGVEILA